MQNRNLFKGFALLLLALVAGCQMLGLTQPESFSERLAYGFGQVTAVREAATMSLQAGSIEKADAIKVQAFADQTREVLDGARAASEAGDPATAEGRLTLAISLLNQLNAYLRSHQ